MLILKGILSRILINSIKDTNKFVKPLDTFYHTYLNENKNSVIDKNMFIALINS